jgi:hypothetical protein
MRSFGIFCLGLIVFISVMFAGLLLGFNPNLGEMLVVSFAVTLSGLTREVLE